MGEVWPTAHIAELCLHWLPAQSLRNGDENRPKGRRAVRGRCWPWGKLRLRYVGHSKHSVYSAKVFGRPSGRVLSTIGVVCLSVRRLTHVLQPSSTCAELSYRILASIPGVDCVTFDIAASPYNVQDCSQYITIQYRV